MCLSAQGVTQLDLNELELALTCSSQAIEILAGGQTCATPQEIYFNHFRVLTAHKLDAHTSLHQAYNEVMRRAEKITERETRASFLTNVPINRQILQAWEAVQQRSP